LQKIYLSLQGLFGDLSPNLDYEQPPDLHCVASRLTYLQNNKKSWPLLSHDFLSFKLTVSTLKHLQTGLERMLTIVKANWGRNATLNVDGLTEQQSRGAVLTC